MQEASSGNRGWLKKSKHAVEEGAAVGSTAEDDCHKADDSCSDSVNDDLSGFGSDVDGNEEHNPKKGFSAKNGFERRGKENEKEGRREENVEGLVCK